MTNLEPCAYCGLPLIIINPPWSIGDDCFQIKHVNPLEAAKKKCPMEMSSYDTVEEAIESSNTRYKRTCHQTNTGDCIKCSECGNFTTTRTVSKRFMPRFCGSCGAEVVDGD